MEQLVVARLHASLAGAEREGVSRCGGGAKTQRRGTEGRAEGRVARAHQKVSRGRASSLGSRSSGEECAGRAVGEGTMCAGSVREGAPEDRWGDARCEGGGSWWCRANGEGKECEYCC